MKTPLEHSLCLPHRTHMCQRLGTSGDRVAKARDKGSTGFSQRTLHSRDLSTPCGAEPVHLLEQGPSLKGDTEADKTQDLNPALHPNSTTACADDRQRSSRPSPTGSLGSRSPHSTYHIEIQAIDANAWVIFDAQVNVFLNPKAKVAGI